MTDTVSEQREALRSLFKERGWTVLDVAEPRDATAEKAEHVGPHFVGEFADRATSRTCPACRDAGKAGR